MLNYTALVVAAEAGTIDCILGDLNITEERREVIDFSDPYYHGGVMLAVRADDLAEAQAPAEEATFLTKLLTSFEKNFIREERWKLIVQGIGITSLITVLSAIFGTVLAFLICLFRRTESRLADAICSLYVRLLQGTPIVVLLMILYYGNTAQSPPGGLAVHLLASFPSSCTEIPCWAPAQRRHFYTI